MNIVKFFGSLKKKFKKEKELESNEFLKKVVGIVLEEIKEDTNPFNRLFRSWKLVVDYELQELLATSEILEISKIAYQEFDEKDSAPELRYKATKMFNEMKEALQNL